MAEATAGTHGRNGATRGPVAGSTVAKAALVRTLEQKLEQGYTVESESDTHAVLVMKGRRRWFGLANAPSVRYEISVDDGGNARSRRI